MNSFEQAMKELNKNDYCKSVKKVLLKNLRGEVVDEVWKKAAEKLGGFEQEYAKVPKEVHMHLDSILRIVAIYMVLKEMEPERAMKFIEEAFAQCSVEKSKFFKKMVRLPFGKTFFLRGFAMGVNTAFGEKGGFCKQIHKADSNMLKFDMLQCPYVTYCKKLGCPELTHIYCDTDIYTYGYLDGIKFVRMQTLGTGGDKCDFLLMKEDK